jgi:ABC-type antimicrobial peptide transport system permease subunit
VEEVGLTSLGAVARYQGYFPFRIPGQATDEDRSGPRACINPVDANFFELVNASVLRGRRFTDADLRSGAGVVVINETLAKRYFAGEDPIDRTIEIREHDGSRPYQIAGVIADLRNIAFNEEPFAELFVPYTQTRSWFSHYFMIRTATDPRAMAEPLREAVRSLNRNQPVSNVSLIESQILQLRNWNEEMRHLMLFFGALGFSLSMIGIYGVVSYTVTERAREIGLRIAIGAVKRDIPLLIIRQSLRLIAIGGAIGAGLAMAGTIVLDGLLYAVSPLDPATYFLVFALVTAATLLASLVPALRAARIDPMAALRRE